MCGAGNESTVGAQSGFPKNSGGPVHDGASQGSFLTNDLNLPAADAQVEQKAAPQNLTPARSLKQTRSLEPVKTSVPTPVLKQADPAFEEHPIDIGGVNGPVVTARSLTDTLKKLDEVPRTENPIAFSKATQALGQPTDKIASARQINVPETEFQPLTEPLKARASLRGREIQLAEMGGGNTASKRIEKLVQEQVKGFDGFEREILKKQLNKDWYADFKAEDNHLKFNHTLNELKLLDPKFQSSVAAKPLGEKYTQKDLGILRGERKDLYRRLNKPFPEGDKQTMERRANAINNMFDYKNKEITSLSKLIVARDEKTTAEQAELITNFIGLLKGPVGAVAGTAEAMIKAMQAVHINPKTIKAAKDYYTASKNFRDYKHEALSNY